MKQEGVESERAVQWRRELFSGSRIVKERHVHVKEEGVESEGSGSWPRFQNGGTGG